MAKTGYYKKSHNIIVFFFLIFIQCGFALGNPAPSSQADALATKGISLFRAGQFQQAYETLLDAFDQSPENFDVNFYLGRSAFEIGNYEMAVMAFERILIASPDENRVKLEIARAYQRLGANDIARQFCHEVLSTNPPPTVEYNIRRFLAYIDSLEQKHFLNGQIVIGVDWNDNIWVTPVDDMVKTIIGDIDLSGVSSEKTEDWIYNGLFGLQHAYRFSDSNYAWKTEGAFYKANYDETGELDLRYIYGSTGPEYFMGKNRVGVRLFLDQIELGGSQYRRSVGFKTAWDHIFRPNLILSSALTCAVKDFPGSPEKDATNTALSFDMRFLHHRIWYGMGLKAERENADDNELSYKRLNSKLSATRELPFKLTGSLNYEYEYSRYDDPALLFAEKREDHKHYAGACLTKKLWHSREKNQFLSLRVNYQHTWAYSNIELYEYTKNLFQTALIYDF